ncbi:MAG: hypothetical protein IPL47_00625 [Phyllobacteriaceae bacterium]|nr:hypothetical protein [Phyllobacteriaceae bacterium]
MRKLVLGLILGVVAAVGAQAAETDRYALEKTGQGYVRMDKATGAMSLCAEKDGQLACAAATDDREPQDSELAALAARVDALEKQVAALQSGSPKSAELPSDEEFEKAMGFMERFFKRFMDMVRTFESENGGSPQKT